MEKIELKLKADGTGAFYITDNEEVVGLMDIAIRNGLLTAYHTEVAEKAEGRGLAKKLLAAMVAHARQQQLKVVPLCPFVHAQFKRHPEEYADLWQQEINS
jgi:predicted GNAT family acetyltransferase